MVKWKIHKYAYLRVFSLEDPSLQLITLEAGLPGKRKSIYMISYQQWMLAGQLNNNSSTVTAQADRWNALLTRWEIALAEGKEVTMVMDANLDAITWLNEPNSLPRHSPSRTHAGLLDALFDWIRPIGVEMITPTHKAISQGKNAEQAGSDSGGHQWILYKEDKDHHCKKSPLSR